jgi:hypothetical protein
MISGSLTGTIVRVILRFGVIPARLDSAKRACPESKRSRIPDVAGMTVLFD